MGAGTATRPADASRAELRRSRVENDGRGKEEGVAEHFSHTTWIVKEGREDDFVTRWTEFAVWSAAEGLRSHAQLLRDIDDSRHFVSFGPWETLDAVRRWRTLPGFHEHVARLSEVLESFEPHTFELIARP
jgi:heme-degrading monooxygenase HmoA